MSCRRAIIETETETEICEDNKQRKMFCKKQKKVEKEKEKMKNDSLEYPDQLNVSRQGIFQFLFAPPFKKRKLSKKKLYSKQ